MTAADSGDTRKVASYFWTEPDKISIDPQMTVLQEDFVHFSDTYHFAEEPPLEVAVTAYSELIDRSFSAVWELHPSMKGSRDWQQLFYDSINLDYRAQEMSRIRDMLPADAEVFDMIDAFSRKVLLANGRIFNRKKTAYLRWMNILSVGGTLVVGLLATVVIDVIRPSLLSSHIPWPWLVPSPIFGNIAAALLVFGIGFTLWSVHFWRELTSLKATYEHAMRDAAGLLSRNLIERTTVIDRQISEAIVHLQKMGDYSAERASEAENYVRLLTWLPGRIGHYENYYRASLDWFVKASARAALRLRTIKIWHFMRYLIAAILAMVAAYYLLPFLPAWSGCSTLASCAESLPSRVPFHTLFFVPGALLGGCVLYGFASWQVFVRTGSPVSSNVNAIIKRKMESSKWTRYADLQIHRKIASVFGAIYTAWLHESQKGQFKGGTGP
ncbi:MAG: hypothetical protein HXY22_09215 [Alphaproteobacteria bacterium]|nr:hypothetical protein [Alphaproteobacteria bacterium]